MPLSRDESARAAQLANLKRGGTVSPGRKPTHGAYATVTEAELQGKTREIFDALAADAPVRAADGGLPPAHTLTVRMLAEVMVRRERVRVTELSQGLEIASGPRKGALRGVVEYGMRLDAQALELAKELGMTPRSGAALGLDIARGRRTLEDEVASAGDPWAQHEPPRGDVVDGTATARTTDAGEAGS